MDICNQQNKEFYQQEFKSLDLNGQILSGKTFDKCQLIECDFTQAQLIDCQFIDCQFIKSNLSVVKLNQSRFLDVIFESCKTIGIDWTIASWPNIALCSPIKFHNSILNDSIFFGLELAELVIKDCKVYEVDFREANLERADFSGCDLNGSLFNETNLSAADFTDATNYAIDFKYNRISGAKFNRYEAIRLLDSLDITLVD
ncbi:MAG: pentapeptide repeat-containing protein [Enterobacterales bacterium]|nr:pentapeptide repeat-containing protein [Enterobacterales bacterium]